MPEEGEVIRKRVGQVSDTSLVAILELPAAAKAGLTESFVLKLQQRGIDSVETFLGMVQGVPQDIAIATGTNRETLGELFVQAMERFVPTSEQHFFLEARPIAEEGDIKLVMEDPNLTEEMDPDPALTDAVAEVRSPDDSRNPTVFSIPKAIPGVTALPPRVSLLGDCLDQPRSQGQRPTCTAFVATSVLEYSLCRFGGVRADLSEQFLYWLLGSNGKLDQYGTASLGWAFVLAKSGVCPQAAWAYEPTFVPGNSTHDPPPQSARTSAIFRFSTAHRVPDPAHLHLGHIAALLASGIPVGVTIRVFMSSKYNPQARLRGLYLLPSDEDLGYAPEYHAVTLVGYDGSIEDPNQSFFVLRNSLEPTWGSEGFCGACYGRLSFSYAALYIQDAWYGRV